MIRINEVFDSIQGEGIYQGVPMTFIRLQGCNLSIPCRYCDTGHALRVDSGTEKEISGVLGEVKHEWVCITGGEPLRQIESLKVLIEGLKVSGHKIEVETNGSILPPEGLFDSVDSWNADIKCPSSGVCGISRYKWMVIGRPQDQIKFVVGDAEDLDYTRRLIRGIRTKAQIMVSPVVMDINEDKEWLRAVWNFACENNIRFSLQTHKVVWGNKKGV